MWFAVLPLLGSIFSLPLVAQKLMEEDQLIRFDQVMNGTQEKFIHEALRSQEPDMGIWVDRPNKQVKLRTHVVLDRSALENIWTPAGLVIVHMGPIGASHGIERAGTAPMAGFPLFIDTGDPQGDAARYDSAKATWIQGHPKEYEVLTRSQQPE